MKTWTMRPSNTPQKLSSGPFRTVLDRIRQFDFKSLPDADLSITMLRLSHRAHDSATDGISAEVFALVNEAVSRNLDIQATDEQLLAGLYLLQGTIVQMNAGEGKTIAAAFPAAVHAIGECRVHIITANDYLAARDAELLAPVYRALGISVGAVIGYMDDDERRHAYRNGIVYSTMRELGFDFLRDNLKSTNEAKVQGKLEVAIIDEADHALIDEAFTPMIISGRPVSDKRAIARVKNAVVEMIGLQRQVAQGLAGQLSLPGLELCDVSRILTQLLLAEPENPTLKGYLAENPGWAKGLRNVAGRDYADFTAGLFYAIDIDHRFVSLAEKGRDFLEQHLGSFYDGRSLEESLDSVWAMGGWTLAERRKKAGGINRRLARQYNLGNHVYQTLRAFLMLHRDVDYFVTEDSVVLIDKSTGRPRVDCIYQQGLQTALETKEGVTSHPDCETLAQISVEGFIQSYQTVCGMTGTASTSSGEFLRKYGLPVAVMFMMSSRTLLKGAAIGLDEPGRVLGEVNDLLHEDNEAEMFVTMLYATYDTKTGQLTYANGGHNTPIVFHADGTSTEFPLTGGLALGLLPDFEYEQNTIHLAPGDTVVFYTDGVTEAMNSVEEEFGMARLHSVFGGEAPKDAQVANRVIFKAVHAFAGDTPQSDDVTCLTLHRNEA